MEVPLGEANSGMRSPSDGSPATFRLPLGLYLVDLRVRSMGKDDSPRT